MDVGNLLKDFEIVTGKQIDYETAHAILVFRGKYILQLRDNNPMISAPGQWSFFGGQIVTGETPEDAIKREVYEELEIKPENFKFLWTVDYYDPFVNLIVRTWFFSAEVSSVWSKHKLNEGEDVKIFRFRDLANIKIPSIVRQAIERFYKKRFELGYS